MIERRVPEWLRFFDTQPIEALDALFCRTFHHGPVHTVEPEVLLLDWADAGRGTAFTDRLDEELAAWVRQRWQTGDPVTPGFDLMWQRALRTLAHLEPVPRHGIEALRERIGEAEARLGPMTRNRAHDPLGWFWAAVSRVQPDDKLQELWLRLCGLEPGSPVFHVHWGLVGLRRMDGKTPRELTELVTTAINHYLVGLDRLVEQRRLPQREARQLAITECRWALRAHPAAVEWPEQWADVSTLPAEARRWLAAAVGTPRATVRSEWDRAVRGWSRRVGDLVQRCRRHDPTALTGMHELLNEQRRYTVRTGHVYYLVRSLCSFSSVLTRMNRQLSQAAGWAEEARRLDSLNPYTWTTTMRCRLALGAIDTALETGYEALDRFPDDAVVRNGLAEILKAGGWLAEAEALYRGALERFPADAVVRNGLAEVLKAAGRYDEAEAIYRRTVADFPENEIAPTGLAEVLKAAGRLGEAEEAYRTAVARFPENEIAPNGLAEVLKADGRLAEAEAGYRAALDRFPDNAAAHNGLAEVLKAAGRLDEAEAAYRAALDRFPDNAITRCGLAEVVKAAGRLDEAEQIYRVALERSPDNPIVRNGLAEVLRALGRLDDAETAYRGALDRFPDNPVTRTGLAEVLKAAGRPDEAAELGRPAAPAAAGPPPRRPSLRARVRRALTAVGRERKNALDELLTEVDEALRHNGADPDALYAKLEALVALHRPGDAGEVLRALPGYLLSRPDFAAMRGKVALAALNRDGSTPYAAEVVDAVVRPWQQASLVSPELREVPAVQRLRASAVLIDGATLDEERADATRAVRAILSRDYAQTQQGQPKLTGLRSWWLGGVRQALTGGRALDEVSTEQFVDGVRERSELLDELEEELLSASRYLITVR